MQFPVLFKEQEKILSTFEDNVVVSIVSVIFIYSIIITKGSPVLRSRYVEVFVAVPLAHLVVIFFPKTDQGKFGTLL